MERGWMLILAAGACEIVWALALKGSNGFADVPYTVVFLLFLIVSMILLSKALDAGIPIGTGYAVWVGIGAAGTSVFGILLMDDPFNAVRMVFISMIVVGVIGLRACEKNG